LLNPKLNKQKLFELIKLNLKLMGGLYLKKIIEVVIIKEYNVN